MNPPSFFYIGSVRNGVMHGAGEQYFKKVPCFAGEFFGGARRGLGTYKFACGSLIRALFADDLPEGKGYFKHFGNNETVFFIKRGKTSSFLTGHGDRYDVFLHPGGELSLSKVSQCSDRPVGPSTNLKFRGKSRLASS